MRWKGWNIRPKERDDYRDRRQEWTERRREHIAELYKRAARDRSAAQAPLRRHENGVANPHDPALKERIAGLKAVRDQAQADAGRARAMAERLGQQAGGGYRRHRLRALAQRVEVADKEVRTMDRRVSYSERLQLPAA